MRRWITVFTQRGREVRITVEAPDHVTARHKTRLELARSYSGWKLQVRQRTKEIET